MDTCPTWFQVKENRDGKYAVIYRKLGRTVTQYWLGDYPTPADAEAAGHERGWNHVANWPDPVRTDGANQETSKGAANMA